VVRPKPADLREKGSKQRNNSPTREETALMAKKIPEGKRTRKKSPSGDWEGEKNCYLYVRIGEKKKKDNPVASESL